ncbi:MAG: c-type cytochrome [Halobacteriovoraceae bacterium]|nr:c-type cytochrome [Halobacteriovoraceae bacterium]
MGTRLILFIVFASLTVFLLTLTSYKDYFNKGEVLNREFLQQKIAEASKPANNETEATAESAQEASEDEDKIDMNDPAIKNGLAVYTEKGQCIKCHGEQGEGNVEQEAPLVAGQYTWYIVDQVAQIKAGTRVNEKMLPYLSELTEQDIEDVAKYINSLRVKE